MPRRFRIRKGSYGNWYVAAFVAGEWLHLLSTGTWEDAIRFVDLKIKGYGA